MASRRSQVTGCNCFFRRGVTGHLQGATFTPPSPPSRQPLIQFNASYSSSHFHSSSNASLLNQLTDLRTIRKPTQYLPANS
ncbi:hypothetical protein Hamer_G009860 [Homarus americanus]|uniref:Uncharacterized protein n=1 Tax=Homarus americanus TaxID=6706 RepID=A0A8J5NA30_HOMAM|nr:hypothetical protein Hamer_G009860 [Homarus americanus]